jgi:hypothetical protein
LLTPWILAERPFAWGFPVCSARPNVRRGGNAWDRAGRPDGGVLELSFVESSPVVGAAEALWVAVGSAYASRHSALRSATCLSSCE